MKNDAISICKAIGIICMVSGHSWLDGSLEKGVNLIDIPLFYFMSGYCFKVKYLSNFLEFLKKRIKGLWMPYVKWGIISILVHNLFLTIGIYSVDGLGNAVPYFSVVDILNKIKTTLLFAEGPDGFLGGYWFLKDMFFASIIAYGVLKISSKNNIILFTCIVLLVFSVLYNQIGIKLPYIHTSTFFSSSIFCLGYYVKKNNIIELICHINLLYVIISFILIFICAFFWCPLKMSSLYLESYNVFFIIPFFFYSIFLTVLLFISSIKVENRFKNTFFKKKLVFIGENTLSILTFHMLWFKLVNYIIYSIYELNPNTIGYFPTNIEYSSKGWFVAYIVVGVYLPLAFPFVKRYYKGSGN